MRRCHALVLLLALCLIAPATALAARAPETPPVATTGAATDVLVTSVTLNGAIMEGISSQAITGLTARTLYDYRLVAVSPWGTSFGADK